MNADRQVTKFIVKRVTTPLLLAKTVKTTEALEGHFYLLLITYYLLLITYHLLLITYYLSLITYYLLLIISYITPITAGNSTVHSL